MEGVFHKALQVVLGCAIVGGSHASAQCLIQKVSDGFFTQTGNGNTLSSTSFGGRRTQLNISDFNSATDQLTFGNPRTTLPRGVTRDKVGIIYTVTLQGGETILTTSPTALEVTSFTYNQPLPSSFVLFVDVEVKEQSGARTTTEDYRLSIDVSC